MNAQHKFHGPLTVDLRIAVTNGELDAVLTYAMPLGKYPAPSEIEAAMQEALTQAPDGFRLMTKREWWEMESKERFGSVYAMPGGSDWDEAPGAPPQSADDQTHE
jgi:hypothetical protein